jgi:hypothetical protein
MKHNTQKSNKLIISTILIIIAIVTGVLIHRGGKPYDTLFFTIHKLAALVAAVITIIKIKKNRMIRYSGKRLIACLAGLFITGALLSVNTGPYVVLLSIHNITTAVILIDSTYLLIALRKIQAS